MQPSNQTVLVTGAATGIGFALASKFLQHGNRVIAVGRTLSALQAARSQLPNLEIAQADVADAADRAHLVSQFPDVSVLVNNAGVQLIKPFQAMTAEELHYEVAINYDAPLALTHTFLPTLLKQRSSAIVNVTSALSFVPKQSAPLYGASKAALHNFTRALRWELESSSIKVFEIIPPLVETAMTAGRGRGKITPQDLAEEFWRSYISDRYEVLIGKAKALSIIQRLVPRLAEKIIRST